MITLVVTLSLLGAGNPGEGKEIDFLQKSRIGTFANRPSQSRRLPRPEQEDSGRPSESSREPNTPA